MNKTKSLTNFQFMVKYKLIDCLLILNNYKNNTKYTKITLYTGDS